MRTPSLCDLFINHFTLDLLCFISKRGVVCAGNHSALMYKRTTQVKMQQISDISHQHWSGCYASDYQGKC